MEEKWRQFLKEHAPELYEDMLKSLDHMIDWRDEEIERLRSKKLATHQISACFYPGKENLVELTWEHIDEGPRVCIETNVDDETGYMLSEIVPACVYHDAVAESIIDQRIAKKCR